MSETSPAVKLMIQAGIVPSNVLQQLVSWKFLPEEFGQLLGSHQASKEWSSVEQFIQELREIISRERAEIRETEFSDEPVAMTPLKVFLGAFLDHPETGWQNAEGRVDLLGRVHLVPESENALINKIYLAGKVRQVLRVEPRYVGDQRSAWVYYLEEKKDAARTDPYAEGSGGVEGDGDRELDTTLSENEGSS